MHTKTVFHNCAESVISQVREYWSAKEAYLDELMTIGAVSPEEATLDLRICREPETNRFAVRAVLPLPLETLTAEALDANAVMAVDRVAELLAQAMRRNGSESPSLEEWIDEVEEASVGSFPASDAPAWTHISVSGCRNSD